jgi:hypothetical protein
MEQAFPYPFTDSQNRRCCVSNKRISVHQAKWNPPAFLAGSIGQNSTANHGRARRVPRQRGRGPFTVHPGEAGIRPGIYAGLEETFFCCSTVSWTQAPFTGLLAVAALAESGSAATWAPGEKARQRASEAAGLGGCVLRQPGINAGPNTACGGKPRKRGSVAERLFLGYDSH